MARLARTLGERHPLPTADDPSVISLLPSDADTALMASDDRGPLGAAWWHHHDPPLLNTRDSRALPELVVADGPMVAGDDWRLAIDQAA